MSKRSIIMDRRLHEAITLLLDERLSIREIAKRLKVSKSTIHKDLSERACSYYSSSIIESIKDQLVTNQIVGRIKGGYSTSSMRKKYSPRR